MHNRLKQSSCRFPVLVEDLIVLLGRPKLCPARLLAHPLRLPPPPPPFKKTNKKQNKTKQNHHPPQKKTTTNKQTNKQPPPHTHTQNPSSAPQTVLGGWNVDHFFYPLLFPPGSQICIALACVQGVPQASQYFTPQYPSQYFTPQYPSQYFTPLSTLPLSVLYPSVPLSVLYPSVPLSVLYPSVPLSVLYPS